MIAIAAPLLLAGVAGAQTPGFWRVGLPPNGTQGQVVALSQNGAIAAGTNAVTDPPPFGRGPGFSWSLPTGRVDWGLQPGMPYRSEVKAMSSSGSVIVGITETGAGPLEDERAFRRVGNGPVESLPLLPNQLRGYASGVSGDGTVIVGWNENSAYPLLYAYGQAYRWTESGGVQGLGYLRPNGSFSVAHGISRDGSTIVGFSQSDGPFGGPFEAFRWRGGEGMTALPPLSNGNGWSEARAANADGSVVVGQSDAGGPDHAVRWVNGLAQDLGTAPAYYASIAYATNDTGEVIGGAATSGAWTSATVWTPATGMVLLADFLSAHGVLVPTDLDLTYAWAVSGDGLTFGGQAFNLQTHVIEGFVATIPSPGTAMVILAPLVLRRRRNG